MDWIKAYQEKISYLKSKEFLATLANKESYLLTDDNLKDLYQKEFFAELNFYSIEAGEQSKTLSQVAIILERLLALNYSKDVIIIGFGGGIVCDIAGFVSAIYKRGCKVVLMPTSLLAMVDACIGGKNGVNSDNYKNQFGTIKQAESINVDLSLLKTLPQDQVDNGMAEVIKHGLISSKDYYQKAISVNLNKGNIENDERVLALIKESISIKLSFVNGDENDQGQRMFLNFGHTLGHTLEKIHNIPHGKAVIWGMIQALKISDKLALISKGQFRDLKAELMKLNTVTPEMIKWDDISQALVSDKKRRGDKITFILLAGLEKPLIKEVDLALVEQVVMSHDE